MLKGTEKIQIILILTNQKRDERNSVQNENKNIYIRCQSEKNFQGSFTPWDGMENVLLTKRNLIWKKLNKLTSLENQVEVLRKQDELGKHTFFSYMKRVFERVTDTVREVCEEVTKTMVETVEEGKKAFAGLNEKKAEVKNDRDLTASFLARTLPYFSLSDKKVSLRCLIILIESDWLTFYKYEHTSYSLKQFNNFNRYKQRI